MPTISGFLKLENRYVITGTLKPAAALHIGSGTVNAETDAPFFRDHLGPLIPGSTLRGVLRSRLEKILQAIGGDRGCVLFTTDADKTHTKCLTVNEKLLMEFREAHASKPTAERERLLEEKLLDGDGLCDICRLFGSPLLASKLRISDARPKAPKTQIRDSVGIDRDTETAREHIKFDFETLDSEGFTLRAEIENASDDDLALLGILFQEMRDPGIEVGGKKSRGLGRCTLSGGLTVQGFSGKDALVRFLASGKLEPIADFQTKLTNCLNVYLGVTSHAAPSKK
jgi:CRISPR-associated RAMP protein (TIGR02581 family)